MRSKPISATELMKRLESDPDWVAKRDAREREYAERLQAWMAELSELHTELANAGIEVQGKTVIARETSSYEESLPILLRHLRRPYGDSAQASIIRAFERKAARSLAWTPLVAALKDGAIRGGAIEAAIAAISAMARPDDLQCLLGLIADRSLGAPRAILVRNLMRSRKPEARETLLALKHDPDLRKEIAHRLRLSRT